MPAGELGKGSHGRCKACARALPAEPARKGKALTEPQVAPVDTGSVHGDPKAAEARRQLELLKLFGMAGEANATTVELLRAGDREGAITHARATDAKAKQVAHRAPRAETAPLGSRDLGMIDGPALVQGGTMNATDGGKTDWTREVPADQLPNALKGAPLAEPTPDAPRPTRRNPATGEVEPRAPHFSGSRRERIDREIAAADRPKPRRTASSKRRHRAKLAAQRDIEQRVKARGETYVPKGQRPTVTDDVIRLRALGSDLPVKGW